jgi:hypothetical protein
MRCFAWTFIVYVAFHITKLFEDKEKVGLTKCWNITTKYLRSAPFADAVLDTAGRDEPYRLCFERAWLSFRDPF